MLNIKPDIKTMIANIYECQKKILYNRRILREANFDGATDDIKRLIDEIASMEKKLHEMQEDLRKRYEK